LTEIIKYINEVVYNGFVEAKTNSKETKPMQKSNHTIILAILTLFLIISSTGFLISYSVETTLLNSDALFDSLKEQGLVKNLYDGADEVLSGMIPTSSSESFKTEISIEEFENFTKTTLSDFTDYFSSARDDIPTLVIPAFGPLTAPLKYNPTVLVKKAQFEQMRGYVSLLAMVKYIFVALSLVFIALIAVLAKPEFRKLKFIGAGLLISGILSLVISFILGASTNTILSELGSIVPAQFRDFLLSIVSAIIPLLSGNILFYSAITSIIGIILVIASIALKRKK